MTEQSSIFRSEALEEHDRHSGPGDVLRAAPGWTTWAFFAVLALVAAALLAASLVEIDRYAQGPTAVADDGAAVVLLPAALAPNVTPGNRVEVGGQQAEVVVAGDTVLHPPEVRRRYGVDVSSPSVAVTTSARATAPGTIGRVLVSSDPVLVQFVPGVDSLLGGRGG